MRNGIIASTLFMGLVGVVLGSCTDERIVYQDRELFQTPPTAAGGFLGYSDTTRKLPVCGNCHVGQNAKWVLTKHANAWADLQASGHATAVCEGCHTVNSLGNPTTGNVGYLGAKEVRYHDVQCESCHGPGLTHVQNPDAGSPPLAPLSVGTGLDTGCGECHTGTHQPFVDEWAQSGHAKIEASPAGRVECHGCHTGEDALVAWGVNADYLEKATVLPSATEHLPIVCGVCHDPHSANNPKQLRLPVDVPNEEQNLCMQCHHKRGTPDPTTFRGPHSPEGPVLLGYAGWWPPNMTFPTDTILATHGSSRNPKLCAGCHLLRFDVTDPATGDFVFHATGHLFLATPCLDGQGRPQPGDCPVTQKTYRTCTAAGCHGTEGVARTLQATATQRLATLSVTLDATLKKINPNWNTCRTNNSCGANSPWNTADGKYTTAEGAAFNYDLAQTKGSEVHNPFLIEALLTSTIQQVRIEYNVSVPPGVVLDNILGR